MKISYKNNKTGKGLRCGASPWDLNANQGDVGSRARGAQLKIPDDCPAWMTGSARRPLDARRSNLATEQLDRRAARRRRLGQDGALGMKTIGEKYGVEPVP